MSSSEGVKQSERAPIASSLDGRPSSSSSEPSPQSAVDSNSDEGLQELIAAVDVLIALFTDDDAATTMDATPTPAEDTPEDSAVPTAAGAGDAATPTAAGEVTAAAPTIEASSSVVAAVAGEATADAAPAIVATAAASTPATEEEVVSDNLPPCAAVESSSDAAARTAVVTGPLSVAPVTSSSSVCCASPDGAPATVTIDTTADPAAAEAAVPPPAAVGLTEEEEDAVLPAEAVATVSEPTIARAAVGVDSVETPSSSTPNDVKANVEVEVSVHAADVTPPAACSSSTPAAIGVEASEPNTNTNNDAAVREDTPPNTINTTATASSASASDDDSSSVSDAPASGGGGGACSSDDDASHTLPGHVHDAHHTRNETHEPHEHTTSVNRSFSDLDPVRFVFFIVLLAAMRMLVQHPLNIALARKQAMPHCATMTTRAVLSGLIRREGYWRALTRGMLMFVGGSALSEGIYISAFEALREFLPIASDVSREAVSGYASDAACRAVHIPLMVLAYRQMVFEPALTAEERAAEGMAPIDVEEEESKEKKGETKATVTVESTPSEAVVPAVTAGTAAATVAAAGCGAAIADAAKSNAAIATAKLSATAKTALSTPPPPTTTASKSYMMLSTALPRGRYHPPTGLAVARAVYKEGGVKSLYAGLGTTLLIGCQWSGVWWALYAYLKAPLYRASDRALVGWDEYDASGRRIAASASASISSGSDATSNNDDDALLPLPLSAERNYTIALLKTSRGWLPSSLQSSFSQDDNMLINGVASVGASTISAVMFNPFLVVRTKMQVRSNMGLRQAIREVYYEGFSGQSSSSSSTSTTSALGANGNMKKGSFKGFFRGLYLSVSMCVLDGVLATLCYEYSKLWSDRSHLRVAAAATPSAAME